MRARITFRDVVVAVVAASQDKPVLKSTVFDWTSFPVRTTETGALRQVVRQPTITLDELEMHVTTLNAGLASHPPHKHTNEELLILREGRRRSSMDSGSVWSRGGSCFRRREVATACGMLARRRRRTTS